MKAKIISDRQSLESKAKIERLKREYDYLTVVDSRWDYKTTSGNLRKVLAHKFPGIKFYVSRRSQGSNSVTIRWIDGPTDEAVNQIGKLFQGLTFDGMTDYEDYVESEFLTLFGALGYVFTERSFSETVIEAEKERVLEDYPQLSDGKNVHYTQITALKNSKDSSVIWFNVQSLVRHRLWDVDLIPKPEATQPPKEKVNTPEPKSIATSVGTSFNVSLIAYSEKSVAVIGDTKTVKNLLKSMGGRFNARLSCGAGWIFSNKKTNELKTALGL